MLAVVFKGRIHISIQRIKGANIYNNIQKVKFTGILHEFSDTQWQCLINPELPHSIKSVDLGENMIKGVSNRKFFMEVSACKNQH